MCTGLVQKAKVSGAGKSPDGWIKLDEVSVMYDCTYHMNSSQGVNIEFVDRSEGPGARVALELNPESAMNLVHAIMESLYSAGIDPGEAALGLEVKAKLPAPTALAATCPS